PLAALIDPTRVKPEALLAMEQQLGVALYTSMHWIWTEALRLLALTGFRIATMPEKKVDPLAQPEEWLLRLGGALPAAETLGRTVRCQVRMTQKPKSRQANRRRASQRPLWGRRPTWGSYWPRSTRSFQRLRTSCRRRRRNRLPATRKLPWACSTISS